MMDTEQIRTPVTDLLKIKHPIMLAGMNVAAGPKLAAAVTNAGGIGVVGGVGYTPVRLSFSSRPAPTSISDMITFRNNSANRLKSSKPICMTNLLPSVWISSCRK